MTRSSPAVFVALGMPMVVTGLMTSRAEEGAFGLSADFLAGFLMSAGICMMIAGLVLAGLASQRR